MILTHIRDTSLKLDEENKIEKNHTIRKKLYSIYKIYVIMCSCIESFYFIYVNRTPLLLTYYVFYSIVTI
jgi:hypothetical protein